MTSFTSKWRRQIETSSSSEWSVFGITFSQEQWKKQVPLSVSSYPERPVIFDDLDRNDKTPHKVADRSIPMNFQFHRREFAILAFQYVRESIQSSRDQVANVETPLIFPLCTRHSQIHPNMKQLAFQQLQWQLAR